MIRSPFHKLSMLFIILLLRFEPRADTNCTRDSANWRWRVVKPFAIVKTSPRWFFAKNLCSAQCSYLGCCCCCWSSKQTTTAISSGGDEGTTKWRWWEVEFFTILHASWSTGFYTLFLSRFPGCYFGSRCGCRSCHSCCSCGCGFCSISCFQTEIWSLLVIIGLKILNTASGPLIVGILEIVHYCTNVMAGFVLTVKPSLKENS